MEPGKLDYDEWYVVTVSGEIELWVISVVERKEYMHSLNCGNYLLCVYGCAAPSSPTWAQKTMTVYSSILKNAKNIQLVGSFLQAELELGVNPRYP